MGSKRVLAEPIINHIIDHNPNVKYLYDLFGGGGAISFEAVQRKQFDIVFYNELNTSIVELLRKIMNDGVTDEFYRWVSREEYKEKVNGNDWFAGLLKSCWSFGNNQKDYMFGKDIEEIKREAHEYLMVNGYDKTADSRTRLLKRFKSDKDITSRFDLQQLERLEQLEQLERLERLEISNLSYEQVEINTPVSETIIYCDPPYFSTAKYKEKLCHDTFLEWVKNSPYKIYVSSYDFDLPTVKELSHRSTLSPTNNAKKTVERLFCNQTESKTTLF